MSCRLSLGRTQVKRFKTTLLSLNKIGGELLIEAAPQQVTLSNMKCILNITATNFGFEMAVAAGSAEHQHRQVRVSLGHLLQPFFRQL